jgi:hypothetical protein
MVRVLDQFSNPLINAPVTFSVTSGDAQVARSNSGSPALHSTLKVETDSEGKALVYLWGGETLGSVTVEAMAGTALALQLKAAITEVPFPTFGLQSWFRADEGIQKDSNGRVTQWNDSTGLGNHATAVLGQEPLWRDNRLNGEPTIYFDGDNDNLQFPVQNSLRTVFLVVRHDTGSQGAAVALGGQNSHDFHGGEGTLLLSASAAASSVVNGNGYINSAPVAPVSMEKPKFFRIISLVTSGNVLADQIGQDRNIPDRSWLGDIAEIILYNEVLTAGDRALVEEYLHIKYALGDSDVPNGDGLIDYWELEQFGGYGETGGGDFDGDGLSNQQEMNDGTSPVDYYNGQPPVLIAYSGNEQVGEAGAFLGEPLMVLVWDSMNQPLANAPVTFTVNNGGQLAKTSAGPLAASQQVITDSEGYAQVYVCAPPTGPTAFAITATAATDGISSSVGFDAETVDTQGAPIPRVGLQAWFRADQGMQTDENGRVTQWEDQSGSGNHAVAPLDQEPQWLENRVNGLPGVYFDGNNKALLFPEQNNLRTVFLVIRHDTGSQDFAVALGSQDIFYDFHGGQGAHLISNEFAASPLVGGAVYVDGFGIPMDLLRKPKAFRIISFVTSSNVRTNQIGRDRDMPERTWRGDIAEILLYGKELTPTNRSRVENYLRGKYGEPILDEDEDGLPDDWEQQHFGGLGQTLIGDDDRDGLGNREEYLSDNDPNDFYNGVEPIVEKVSGDNQFTNWGSFYPEPLVLRVRKPDGTPWANAPVVFTVNDNGEELTDTEGGTVVHREIEVRTDAEGKARVWRKLPE